MFRFLFDSVTEHSITKVNGTMPDTTDVISFSEAAQEKDCSRTTLYRAADDGRLNDTDVGGRRMIVKDEKWQAFEPEFIGGRAEKYSDDTSDESS